MKSLLIVTGSKSDLPRLKEIKKLFIKSGIQFEIESISSHRNIKELVEKLESSRLKRRGCKVILAISHSVSNLPAIIAGYLQESPIIVIGCGTTKTSADTISSLISPLSIPKGIPLATTGVNEVGIYNAGLLCIKILQNIDKS